MYKIIIADSSIISDEQFSQIYNIVDIDRRNKVDLSILFKDKKLSLLSGICLDYLLSMYYPYSSNFSIKRHNKYGKPSLANYPNIHYSISHSGNKCVVVISNDTQIGVDIECLSSLGIEDSVKLINKYFTSNEINCVSDSGTSLEQFLTLWTKKEAAYKSIGNSTLLQYLKTEFSEDELLSIISLRFEDYILSLYSGWKTAPIIPIIYCNNQDLLNIIIERVRDWKNV